MKTALVIITITLISIIIGCPFLAIRYCNYFLIVIDGPLVSFLGSYIGALITGFVSIFCILVSVYFARKQNEKEQEFKIRPYFDFECKRTDKPIPLGKDLGYIAFEFESDTKNNEKHIPNIHGLLLLKNVGLGTALHCSFSYAVSECKRKWSRFFYSNPQKDVVMINAFQPGEEGSLAFHILLNLDPMPRNGLTLMEDGKRTQEPDLIHEYSSFVLKIKFSYSDLMENWYHQELIFEPHIHYHYLSSDNEEENYFCDLSLSKISQPHKNKNTNKHINRNKGNG